MKRKPRLLLVEDHAMVSEALTRALSDKFRVVGVVQDGAEVMDAISSHTPDLVLLDLSLPNRGGTELIEAIRAADGPPILVVTMHTEWAMVDTAMRLGAAGFVPKDAKMHELEVAIECVLDGVEYISPLLRRKASRGPAHRLGFEQLTPRQQEVVLLVSEGLSNEEIGARLGVSHHTIHFHRTNVRKQLGLKTDFEMYRYALLVAAEQGGEESTQGPR